MSVIIFSMLRAVGLLSSRLVFSSHCCAWSIFCSALFWLVEKFCSACDRAFCAMEIADVSEFLLCSYVIIVWSRAVLALLACAL